jgi:uncharacterized protein (DUF736 family)
VADTGCDVEIGARRNRRSEASGNEYISLSLTAPEFGPRRLYANLARAAGEDREDRFVILWNRRTESLRRRADTLSCNWRVGRMLWTG